MPENKSKVEYTRALEDFRRARAKARLQHLWAAVTGESKGLLPYDEISQKMHATGLSSKGLKEITVDAIVGSVNRYQDFDKNFLPLHDRDMERWANVKAAMTSPGGVGLPAIRVYKIGEAYFVLDGNHRVSIARQMGIKMIEAYVTEIRTKVPFSPEDSPDDIILKSEYSDFLEKTKIDKIVPEAELKLTFPGQHETLLEHISVHRYYMGIEQAREISWEDAVQHWYYQVYTPVVEIILNQDILQEFPERTETDLYIWVLDHQTYMEEDLGWSFRPEKAAIDLVNKRGMRFIEVVKQTLKKIIRTILPKELEDFSSPGEWHEKKRVDVESLFSDILVAMSGRSESWIALEQAIIIAEHENAHIRGLIVQKSTDSETLNRENLTKAFSDRLEYSNIEGNLVFARGNIADTICDRAKYNDLLVLKLSHPPSHKIFKRLTSGMRRILRKSTRPILVVPNKVSQMSHILLAYDGSPKGKEALYVAAYLANRYERKLTVLVVYEDEVRGQALLAEAKDYLGSCCLNSQFRQSAGRISKIILEVSDEEAVDMIIMGGYGFSPIWEAVFGSTVDGVLRGTSIPVIVCQ